MLNGIARDFGVFDHWFSEVPSQTFMNRSFWTAATSSGLVVNNPVRRSGSRRTTRETLFERLEATRQDLEGLRDGADAACGSPGVIHYSRLKDRLATHFVPFAEFERDAADGTLPDFSFIEPNMHGRPRGLPPGLRPVVSGRTSRLRLDPPVVDARR